MRYDNPFAFRRQFKQCAAMKIQPGWRFHLLTAVFCALCLAPLARGQGAGLTFTVASESVTAGAAVSVWLNVLNPSG